MAALRSDFPILDREVKGHPLVYLDNAATTQKPQAVLAAMDAYYRTTNANVHRGVYTMAEEATEQYEGARARVAALINAPRTEQLIFTRNTTEGTTILTHGLDMKAGDEVLMTQYEHNSLRETRFRHAKRFGYTVKEVKFPMPATNAQISESAGIALDSSGQTLYVADTDNNRIRQVSGGVITTRGGALLSVPVKHSVLTRVALLEEPVRK